MRRLRQEIASAPHALGLAVPRNDGGDCVRRLLRPPALIPSAVPRNDGRENINIRFAFLLTSD